MNSNSSSYKPKSNRIEMFAREIYCTKPNVDSKKTKRGTVKQTICSTHYKRIKMPHSLDDDDDDYDDEAVVQIER